MKIKDFIQGRNVSYQTVRKYINNHSELFRGHIGKKNNIVLDEVAVELLEEKYPLPTPVEIIQDTAARNELEKVQQQLLQAQQTIIRLQETILEVTPKLAEAETMKNLLAAEKVKTEELQEENAILKAAAEKEVYEKTWFGLYRKKREG